VQPWIPSAWRKTVGLPGNASKGDVANFVWRTADAHEIARAAWPQDACDAYCIALATRMSIQVTA
jgi:Holliday junction resolvasome RuvABC endonuclease subunit